MACPRSPHILAAGLVPQRRSGTKSTVLVRIATATQGKRRLKGDLEQSGAQLTEAALEARDVALRREEARDAARPVIVPRVAALHWFGGASLLVLGMSFIILPRGPINPLYGLISLRGPFFVLSGLALMWLSIIRLSPRGSAIVHLAAALPPLAVAAQYAHLGNYGPAVTLTLLALAIALSPLARSRPAPGSYHPDAFGVVFGLALLSQGLVLLAQSDAPVLPWGVQPWVATAFVAFGTGVFCVQVIPRVPPVLAYAAHVLAGTSLLALWIILAVGISPSLWVLDASGVLLGVALISLPWLSPHLAARRTDRVRAQLAVGLFTGALVPLLIAVPIVLAPEDVATSTYEAAFGVTLALSILAAVAGWLLAWRMVNPLSSLVRGVERIAAGARPVELESGGPLEIRELAAAVQRMAGQLDRQVRQVERSRDEMQASAEKLQNALKVTTGAFEGVDLGYVYQSAGESAQIGGDFYDVFQTGDGRIGILIGDVSGKGLDAAAQAVLLRASFRAFTFSVQRPGEAMAQANKLLMRQATSGFVTAFLGILDTESGELLFSSAGHPPAILIAASQPSLFDRGGPLLGVFPDAEFDEVRLTLAPGDTLLLYTDGLTEARRQGALLGTDAVMAQVQDLAELPPEALTERLYARAVEYAGGSLGDDLALLAVRLQPHETLARL